MASSASGQDEPNRAMWLATRAGKMELSCPLGTIRCVPQEKFQRKPYNKSFIDQVYSVKMAGYWPRSFFCEFKDLDFVSVYKHAKKNEANIQPSWPHTWSITHTYCIVLYCTCITNFTASHGACLETRSQYSEVLRTNSKLFSYLSALKVKRTETNVNSAFKI